MSRGHGKWLIDDLLEEKLHIVKPEVQPWCSELVYICHACKREVTPEGLKTLPGVKCPYCGGRILYKVRPPVVKRVKGV
ncbi:hypothetical protein EU537_07920 [Candidatus Thorarchaeota archaeon]|nr:MAG: hypothetical protein EU537_07920 [Candidatus Thorarchaeota archaeon]